MLSHNMILSCEVLQVSRSAQVVSQQRSSIGATWGNLGMGILSENNQNLYFMKARLGASGCGQLKVPQP